MCGGTCMSAQPRRIPPDFIHGCGFHRNCDAYYNMGFICFSCVSSSSLSCCYLQVCHFSAGAVEGVWWKVSLTAVDKRCINCQNGWDGKSNFIKGRWWKGDVSIAISTSLKGIQFWDIILMWGLLWGACECWVLTNSQGSLSGYGFLFLNRYFLYPNLTSWL
jgi:hypothetical protein